MALPKTDQLPNSIGQGSRTSFLVDPPDQVDYRATPNLPVTATQERGQNSRDNPFDRGSVIPPQPNVGHEGYTMNQLEAPPNQMVDLPSSPPLSAGNVPDDPTSLGAWDFWETT